MKLVYLALIGFPSLLLAATGLPSQPYIYVEGTADTQKPPDRVTLNFRVSGRSAERAKANEDVQARVTKTIALLKDAKVAENDIVAENLTSEPEYEENEDRTSNKIIGYIVTREMSVTIHDVPRFPKIVDDLIAHVDIDFSSIEPGPAKETEIGQELISSKKFLRRANVSS